MKPRRRLLAVVLMALWLLSATYAFAACPSDAAGHSNGGTSLAITPGERCCCHHASECPVCPSRADENGVTGSRVHICTAERSSQPAAILSSAQNARATRDAPLPTPAAIPSPSDSALSQPSGELEESTTLVRVLLLGAATGQRSPPLA